jgi:hypothetical protein
MIVQVFLGKRDVFDRARGDVDLKGFELVDPDPAHGYGFTFVMT